MKPMTRIRLSLVLAAAVTAVAASAQAQNQPTAGEVAGTNVLTPGQYALFFVKKSSDTLSAAKSFTVRAVSSAESPSPDGRMITYFSPAEVAVQRPNKLMAKRTGDGPAFDVY